MIAGHRAGEPAPCRKVADGDLSPALLLPPADIVRPAQAPAAMRLAGAGGDLARPETRQRRGLGAREEGLQRKLQSRAMVLVGVAQLQSSRAHRARASCHRAQDLAVPLGPHRPGENELLDAEIAPLEDLTARRA